MSWKRMQKVCGSCNTDSADKEGLVCREGFGICED